MHERSEGTVPFFDAAIYDAFFERVIDYEKQADQIAAVLSERGLNSVIELGCGTGTLLIHLAKRGFCCLGVDLSDTFLLEAKKKATVANVSVRFIKADITKLRINEKFDAAVCLRVPLSPRDIRSTLDAIYDHLNTNGVLIMEFLVFNDTAPKYWSREWPNPFTTLKIIEHGEKHVVKITSFHLYKDRIAVTPVYLWDERGLLQLSTFNYSLWPIPLDQIRAILSETGFTLVNTLFIEIESVPGADGYVLLAEKMPRWRSTCN